MLAALLPLWVAACGGEDPVPEVDTTLPRDPPLDASDVATTLFPEGEDVTDLTFTLAPESPEIQGGLQSRARTQLLLTHATVDVYETAEQRAQAATAASQDVRLVECDVVLVAFTETDGIDDRVERARQDIQTVVGGC